MALNDKQIELLKNNLTENEWEELQTGNIRYKYTSKDGGVLNIYTNNNYYIQGDKKSTLKKQIATILKTKNTNDNQPSHVLSQNKKILVVFSCIWS